MNDQPASTEPTQPGSEDRRGLPMASKTDPEALAKEKAYLAALEDKPLLARVGGYFSLSGPGWLQSAMTLGGGSSGSSLFAGALLWCG